MEAPLSCHEEKLSFVVAMNGIGRDLHARQTEASEVVPAFLNGCALRAKDGKLRGGFRKGRIEILPQAGKLPFHMFKEEATEPTSKCVNTTRINW